MSGEWIAGAMEVLLSINTFQFIRRLYDKLPKRTSKVGTVNCESTRRAERKRTTKQTEAPRRGGDCKGLNEYTALEAREAELGEEYERM